MHNYPTAEHSNMWFPLSIEPSGLRPCTLFMFNARETRRILEHVTVISPLLHRKKARSIFFCKACLVFTHAFLTRVPPLPGVIKAPSPRLDRDSRYFLCAFLRRSAAIFLREKTSWRNAPRWPPPVPTSLLPPPGRRWTSSWRTSRRPCQCPAEIC